MLYQNEELPKSTMERKESLAAQLQQIASHVFVPKQVPVEAYSHDGTEESALAMVEWINQHGTIFDAAYGELDGPIESIMIEGKRNIVTFVQEWGHEIVMPGTWVVFDRYGEFTLYSEDEFEETYELSLKSDGV